MASGLGSGGALSESMGIGDFAELQQVSEYELEGHLLGHDVRLVSSPIPMKAR